MKKIWNVLAVIMVLFIGIGAVCAAVGVMTGADFTRIGGGLTEYIADKYNVDAYAFFHDWIPQALAAVRAAFI